MLVIIDYGLGNLKSLTNALDKLKIENTISSDYNVITNAKKLILPGVGAFPDGKRLLKEKKLDSLIIDLVNNKKPILGICLGMQLLFDKSYEYKLTKGLGLLKGEVVKFDNQLLVPHNGFNKLHFKEENKLYMNIDDCFVYFLHSYYVKSTSSEIVSSYTNYGLRFVSSVKHNNIYGVQYHPEKSGDIGLKILRNYWEECE